MRLVPDSAWGVMTVWSESRSESFAGMVAVGEVVWRRTVMGIFSKGTVASTVLWPYQFSCWNTKDANRLLVATLDTDDRLVQTCARAWQEAINGSDLTKGGTHYYNPAIVTPGWAHKMTVTARIGRHCFLKEG